MAALQGVPLKDLIVKGLQMAVEQNSTAEPFRQDFPLIRGTNPGRVLTPEDVQQALGLLEHEEAQSVAATLRR